MSAKSKIELWFFREMSDEQRLALFSIFGYPVDEIGKTHGHQRKALRRILSDLDVDRDRQLSQSSHGAVRVEEAAVAGWNACRKSIYAVCEDVQSEADRLQLSSKPGTASEEQHAKGYYAGSRYAAKSIAKGFGAMDGRDDDNLVAALASLETAAPGREEAIPLGESHDAELSICRALDCLRNDLTQEAFEQLNDALIAVRASPPTGKDAVQAVTEEMVEAAARAMCARDGFNWMPESCMETANGDEPEEQREYWRDKARAALSAALQQKETGQ